MLTEIILITNSMVILLFLQQGPKVLTEELSYRLTFLLLLVKILQTNKANWMCVCERMCVHVHGSDEREINLI